MVSVIALLAGAALLGLFVHDPRGMDFGARDRHRAWARPSVGAWAGPSVGAWARPSVGAWAGPSVGARARS